MGQVVGDQLRVDHEVAVQDQASAGDDAWIRVKSGTFSFLVKKKVLLRSGTLKDMMGGPYDPLTYPYAHSMLALHR